MAADGEWLTWKGYHASGCALSGRIRRGGRWQRRQLVRCDAGTVLVKCISQEKDTVPFSSAGCGTRRENRRCRQLTASVELEVAVEVVQGVD